MSDVWETKDGRRRVRRDPPTVEEAVLAAQGLTDELGEQIEIVASLMEVSADEARGAVLRMGQRKDVNRITIAGRVRLAAARRRGRAAHAPAPVDAQLTARCDNGRRLQAPPPIASAACRDRRSCASSPGGAR